MREELMKKKNALPPVHPGEIIREDILPEIGLSVTGAAKALGVSRQMLHDVLGERKPLSAVMCLKVSRLFGSTPEFWMRLQAAYDLKRAAEQEGHGTRRADRAGKAGKGSLGLKWPCDL